MSASIGAISPTMGTIPPPAFRPYFWKSHPAWFNEGRENAVVCLMKAIELHPYGPIYPLLRPSSQENYLAISFVTSEKHIAHTLLKINYDGSFDLFRGKAPDFVHYMHYTKSLY